jgi:hypothetical protein
VTRSLAFAALAVAAIACGPSFQAVYECDVRFEHCYALDQGAAGPDAKKDCWREWLHGYTYGESRDRIEYAATRVSELSLGGTLPKEDRDVPQRPRPMALPAPTNAFAPPPNVADHESPVAPVPRPAPAIVGAPGEDCAQSCGSYWKTCRQSCKDAACEVCDHAYKLCMPSCFKK